MTGPEITQEEVDDFARQLERFRSELSPIQQGLLSMILIRAASADQDVEGQGLYSDAVLQHYTYLNHVAWPLLQHYVNFLITHGSSVAHHTIPLSHGLRPE